MTTRRQILSTLMMGAALATPFAHAQTYPDRPIKIVVPFPAGGSVDAAMRLLQPRLQKALGATFVIDNVGGVGGALGAAKVAAAAADGYTLLAGTNNDIVLAPVLNPNVRYATQDFTPIGAIATNSSLLVARKDLPQSTLDELIQQLRTKPESITYGSPGVGTFQHLTMEDLQQRAQVRMVHVPYKGAGPIVNDVIGGQIDLAILVPSTALPHLRAGRLKAIGLAQLQRDPLLKDVPTLNEGKLVSGIEARGWIGLFAPKGLAPERLDHVRRALEAALADKTLAASLGDLGFTVVGAAERSGFAGRIAADEAKARSIRARMQ
ncbi:Bug family tripartite tricarboxylate transporter substrate binding protein [Variovorax sp. PBL-E5]|uniref:Bug family tripartite tricarboxylate transporter substrate binding protein n=1 Tax=Variovorax sp. PBL-E5 TaxID=434014 RepID=UPI0013180430|nr:tripartite tricarboxylate transporter substrate binding protein [Variovorax sp. PBL-E5]VTU39104.1 Argininosuccinate lyase [Variovorax sp. PBL-E5]